MSCFANWELAKTMRIEVNPAADIQLEQFADDYSCVVVDDFLKDPDAVVEFACSHASEFSIPPRSYPGVVLPVDETTMAEIYRFFRLEMSKQFSFLRGGMSMSSLLSMTTLQPAELSNLQRLCHTDPKTRPGHENFAALVYLFKDEELGGTAFYRWQQQALLQEATAIDLDDPDAALSFLKQHFPTYEKPPSYMTESNEIAELVGMVPARFNRMIFYSGDLPHSAYITSPNLLTDDFSTGRVTLNCFASVRAIARSSA